MSVEIPWYGILFFAILFLEIAYYINATVFPIGGLSICQKEENSPAPMV